MKAPFHPVCKGAATVALTELPTRLTTNTEYTYLYRGSEGKSLQAQTRQNLRWYQLFRSLNRRATP